MINSEPYYTNIYENKYFYTNIYNIKYSKYLICYLTLNPNETLLDIYNNLYNENYNYLIVVDDNDYDIEYLSKKYDKFYFIKVDEEVCKKFGYINSSFLIKNNEPSAWDKAIYIICEYFINKFKYVWFIEDDVFIPTKNTIQKIDCKYLDNDYDLLIQGDYKLNQNWDNYLEVEKYLPEEYKKYGSYSMICAIRMSNNLMYYIKEYINKYKKMFFVESFFITISKYYKLKIKVIEELHESIIYQKDWNIEDIEKDKLYHPIKDISKLNNFHNLISFM